MDRSAIAAPRAKVVLELPTTVPADDAPPDALRILFSARRRRPLRGLIEPGRATRPVANFNPNLIGRPVARRPLARTLLRAGYSSASAGRGGRAAAVRACKLLKDTEIRRAIDEIRAERAAALSALAAERGRQKLRAKLSAIAVADGPQSAAARILRRLDRQPVVRVPDHCRCGGPVTPGCASCESCRFRRREYRRRWRADPWHRERERLLRREREWAVHAAKAAAIV